MDKKLEQYLNNRDIWNIMLSISNRFSNYLDSHTISSSFHITLKKCIDKYDETRGAKFTSYFYQQYLYCLKNHLKSTQISRQREINFRNGEIPIHHKKKDGCSRKRERRLGRDAQIILGIKDIAAEAKASRQVQLILDSLPEESEKILRQKYFDRLTFKEIGEANGYSRETARRKLKKAFELCRK